MTATHSKRIIVHCRKPPYGNALSREAIDIALASSVFDQQLAIIFSGDGVWQLTKDQHSDGIPSKNHQRLLSALPLYDLNEIYVETQALQQRHLEITNLNVPARAVNQQELAELLEHADIIFNF